jgi:hypothetical protein
MTDLGKYLPIYLNDHLAGATAGLELSRRLYASNRENEAMAPTLSRISAEIEADRKTLEDVLERLGVPRSPVKPGAAWLLERLARLKPNGRARSYSPLSRLLELEGLAMGIGGKIELWWTLAELRLDEPAGVDFDELAARAGEQRAAVTDLHQLAVAAMDAPREGVGV